MNRHQNKHFVFRLMIMCFFIGNTIALYTQYCSHDQIKSYFKGYFACMFEMKEEQHNAGLKMLKNETTEWCDMVAEETQCFTKSLGPCLGQKLTRELEILYISSAVKNDFMKCDRIGNQNVDTIESKAQEIILDYMLKKSK